MLQKGRRNVHSNALNALTTFLFIIERQIFNKLKSWPSTLRLEKKRPNSQVQARNLSKKHRQPLPYLSRFLTEIINHSKIFFVCEAFFFSPLDCLAATQFKDGCGLSYSSISHALLSIFPPNEKNSCCLFSSAIANNEEVIYFSRFIFFFFLLVPNHAHVVCLIIMCLVHKKKDEIEWLKHSFIIFLQNHPWHAVEGWDEKTRNEMIIYYLSENNFLSVSLIKYIVN